MNAWLKRCVFNLDLTERVCLNPGCYQEGYYRVWEQKCEKALPPLVDFAILVTTKSLEFCDHREQNGLQDDRRLVKYVRAKPFRPLKVVIFCNEYGT